MLNDFVPFNLYFFMGGYLYTYYLVLCVQMGYQAIRTDFTQKSIYKWLAKNLTIDLKSSKMASHLASNLSCLHFCKPFFAVFSIVSRMQIQHGCFLSGLKYFNINSLHSEPWAFFLKALKLSGKSELLVIFFHPHALGKFYLQNVILIQGLLIEDTGKFLL